MTKTPKKLATFVLVQNKKLVSPVLTTIREYGRWMEENFDEYTCNCELYMRTIRDGKTILTYHPGTNIGRFFDKNKPNGNNLQSWFVLQDCDVVQRLKKQKLAEMRDCIPISVNDDEHRRMLRLYTPEQIELYIKNNLDRNFNISDHVLTPKQINISAKDNSCIIAPKVTRRRSLLDRVKTQ